MGLVNWEAAPWLESGERRVLTVDISSNDLMIFDEESDSRILPAGEYEFRAGFSSRDVCATAAASLSPHHGSSPG